LNDLNQPSHHQPKVGSIFGDSSGPLFSLYSKIAEEEDNKGTDRWQKDADGILIFVSDPVVIPTAMCMNRSARQVCFLLQ
jgi:hypothetical protein